MFELATIGYEGAELDDFVETLRAAGIETLLDIRALPMSRRKGFSKTALASAVEAVGISYLHMKGLGDPKEGREAARAGKYEKFLRIFMAHMKTSEARADLRRAIEFAKEGGACLMCYERDPRACHRKLVAEEVCDKISLRIWHLGVKKGISTNGKRRPRKSPHTRESLTACG